MPIEKIIEKIKQDYEEKIKKLEEDFSRKEKELREDFNKKVDLQKKLLKEKYNSKLELEKKRIYTEKFIEFSKNTEFRKQQLLKEIFEEGIKKILEVPKQEYRNFIKKLILENLFTGKKNEIVFGTKDLLSKKEQQELVEEIKKEYKQKYKQEIEVFVSSKEKDISFGVVIISEKQSKDLSLDCIIDTLRAEMEIEIGRELFN